MSITLFKKTTEQFFNSEYKKIDYDTFNKHLENKEKVNVEISIILITTNLEKNTITVYYGRLNRKTMIVKLKNNEIKSHFKTTTKFAYSITINTKTGVFHNYYSDLGKKPIIRRNSIVEIQILKQLESKLHELDLYDYYIGLFNYNLKKNYKPYDLSNLYNFILCNYYIKNNIRINHIYDINLIEPYIHINRKNYHNLNTLEILIKSLDIKNPTIIALVLQQLYTKINGDSNRYNLNYLYHKTGYKTFDYINLPLIKIFDLIKDVNASKILNEISFDLKLTSNQIDDTKSCVINILLNADLFKNISYDDFYGLLQPSIYAYNYNKHEIKWLVDGIITINENLKKLNLKLKTTINDLTYGMIIKHLEQIKDNVISDSLIVLSQNLIKLIRRNFGKNTKIMISYSSSESVRLNIKTKTIKKPVKIEIWDDLLFTILDYNNQKLVNSLNRYRKNYRFNNTPYTFIYDPAKLKNVPTNFNENFEYIR